MVTSQPRTRALLATVVAASALLGCSDRAGVQDAGADTSSEATPASTATLAAPLLAPSTSAAATSAAPATSGAPATSVDAVEPAAVIDGGPKGLASGAKGPAVSALEARLEALRFSAGRGDGAYDQRLTSAVMAFQKQQDLPRTGRADPTTLAKLATAGLGGPMVASGEPTRVEIDLRRQIAQFWREGRLLRVLAVSTGNGRPYCAPKDKGGACDVAITPGGSYRADRKISGLRVSALGSLYDPVYFYGGIAIHGSGSIPPTPASHGCVRVAMWESAWVYNAVGIGDPVYVIGGKVAPVPFGETAPAQAADEVAAPSAAT